MTPQARILAHKSNCSHQQTIQLEESYYAISFDYN